MRVKGEGDIGEVREGKSGEGGGEVGDWVRMLQTELEGGRGIHNTSGEFTDVISIEQKFMF